ncbi:SpaA isopeptide-forming pilin-related protein, partial [Dysosmobacter sp.]|uniref:SpaA isopeptide-forming pilin-related protein n=1 Tax=Dysosmobacter sp. TaxID=2591382 RepID=UPI003AF0F7E1
IIRKVSSGPNKEPLEGVEFKITYADGSFVPDANGELSSNGIYYTNKSGEIRISSVVGTVVATETKTISGFTIDEATRTQTVVVNPNDTQTLTFYNKPTTTLILQKYISGTKNEPLAGVQFLVTDSSGAVVGPNNGYYTTDAAGQIVIEGLTDGMTVTAKEVKSVDGFVLDGTPQSIKIDQSQSPQRMTFWNERQGALIINKLSSLDRKTPLKGVTFKITTATGEFVPDENGKISSNGLYYTDENGQIILKGVTGTLVVTEVETIPGYTIEENTRTQTVVINPNDTQTLHFYNDPVGGVEIIKVNADNHSERIPNTTFEIRKVDDALVDTVTTDKNGRVFVALEDGSYYAKEVTSNKSFRLDDTPHYFEIKDGKRVTLQVTNKKLSGIVIHKIDSVTGEGIYGVKFVLYDVNKKPIGEYTSDDEGYIYIDEIPGGLSGRFYLRELEAAPGYTLDKQYKTVYVSPGKTVEIEWENTAVTGQIQIYKYAAEYNEVTGTVPGTPLKGAVYEIVNARSGKVVDYITTDARGVAASKPLPLTRYQLREVTAPAYWQLDPTVHDVTLEYPGQIIKLSAYDKPSSLGVSITKRGNAQVMAGQSMRYDLTVANTSNVPLESFFWHDKIPYDVARPTTLTTGTYSARLNYRILYKTNYNASYQVLASNLLTGNNYSFALNAIPMQAGEVVTDIYFDFGKVPVGFQSVVNPTLSVMVNGNAVNGYQMVNRADVGGKYQGTWQTATASWVTIIRRLWNTPTLPKTGY